MIIVFKEMAFILYSKNLFSLLSFVFQSDDEPVLIPHFPKNCNRILWDSLPSRTFVVFENKSCTTYIFAKYSINSEYYRMSKSQKNGTSIVNI